MGLFPFSVPDLVKKQRAFCKKCSLPCEGCVWREVKEADFSITIFDGEYKNTWIDKALKIVNEKLGDGRVFWNSQLYRLIEDVSPAINKNWHGGLRGAMESAGFVMVVDAAGNLLSRKTPKLYNPKAKGRIEHAWKKVKQ